MECKGGEYPCHSIPFHGLTLLHSEKPKLYAILVFLSAMGLNNVVQKKNRVWIELKSTLESPSSSEG